MEKPIIALNSAYLETDHYPRQKKSFEELNDRLKRRMSPLSGPEVVPIRLAGKDNREVVNNICQQLRDGVRGVMNNSRMIVHFGDGGNSRTTDATRIIYPGREVILSPGGSFNYGARSVGTHKVSDIEGILTGEIDSEVIDMVGREVTYSTFNKDGKELESRTSPWTFFMGTEIDAFIMHAIEQEPRGKPTLIRLFNTLSALYKHVKEGSGEIRLRSFTTLPFFGIARLADERNLLDKKKITHFDFKSKKGIEAVIRMFICGIIGTTKHINGPLWRYFSKRANDEGIVVDESVSDNGLMDRMVEIVRDTTPVEIEDEHTIRVEGKDDKLQIDSVPVDLKKLGLEPDGYTYVTVSSTNDVTPVVKRVA